MNCPKHVEFYSKIKLEKLMRLVGFIIRIFQMHGHLNVKYWQQVQFRYSLRQLTQNYTNNLLTKFSDIP